MWHKYDFEIMLHLLLTQSTNSNQTLQGLVQARALSLSFIYRIPLHSLERLLLNLLKAFKLKHFQNPSSLFKDFWAHFHNHSSLSDTCWKDPLLFNAKAHMSNTQLLSNAVSRCEQHHINFWLTFLWTSFLNPKRTKYDHHISSNRFNCIWSANLTVSAQHLHLLAIRITYSWRKSQNSQIFICSSSRFHTL